jgi:hypothetical protein
MERRKELKMAKCPISTPRSDCPGDLRCAWWRDDANCCSVFSIAFDLEEITNFIKMGGDKDFTSLKGDSFINYNEDDVPF